MIKADVANLLSNWKFAQALQAADIEHVTEAEIHIIGSLSRMFGDVNVLDGEMGILVATVVDYLLLDREYAVHQR